MILLGLGIDEFSMGAGSIPIIKKIIRALSLDEVKGTLEKIMELATAREVREFILRKMKPVFPDLEDEALYG
jgi:phosphotransferase system enzyme I (PtsI)